MRLGIFIISLCTAGILGLTGCSDQNESRQIIESVNMSTNVTAEDVDTAIQYAKLYTTKTEKVAYLVKQGRLFYQNQDYASAAEVARHILENIDPNSKMAQELLDAAIEKSKSILGEDVQNILK